MRSYSLQHKTWELGLFEVNDRANEYIITWNLIVFIYTAHPLLLVKIIFKKWKIENCIMFFLNLWASYVGCQKVKKKKREILLSFDKIFGVLSQFRLYRLQLQIVQSSIEEKMWSAQNLHQCTIGVLIASERAHTRRAKRSQFKHVTSSHSGHFCVTKFQPIKWLVVIVTFWSLLCHSMKACSWLVNFLPHCSHKLWHNSGEKFVTFLHDGWWLILDWWELDDWLLTFDQCWLTLIRIDKAFYNLWW
jgi:hypothetical protein